MGTEEIAIRKIEGAIRSIRLGTKEPKDTNIGYFLNRLQEVNEGMYEDYLVKYVKVMKGYNERKGK